MSLQNRVTPRGEIVASGGRGLMMGNRGILHDDNRRIVRYSQVRRWITCLTEYRGIRRVVMRPHSWTELFFLDEATAFAAGHRPCAECRRPDYRRYCELWATCFGEPVGADIVDRQLHQDRLAGPRTKRTYKAQLADLPDGAYIADVDRAWLLWGDALFAWSPLWYTERRKRSGNREVDVLTPRSTVAVFAAGYRPAIHPSAEEVARQ
ncbi:MAG TPA: hypothetical protein VII69_06010 [Candidatus Eremiobacteraceae bacterium]